MHFPCMDERWVGSFRVSEKADLPIKGISAPLHVNTRSIHLNQIYSNQNTMCMYTLHDKIAQ